MDLNSLSTQYRDMLLRLLPKGKIWNIEAGSFIYKTAWGCADELARLHLRGLQLIEEADPRTTVEMLTDWQRTLGLPDVCCPPNQSSAQQRAEVVIRFKGGYGNSPEAFIQIAADLGFTITVVPFFTPFQVNNIAGTGYAKNCTVGGALTNTTAWANTFAINASLFGITSHFRTGQSVVGDPLRSWGNTQLQCKILAAIPAHSIVLFVYT